MPPDGPRVASRRRAACARRRASSGERRPLHGGHGSGSHACCPAPQPLLLPCSRLALPTRLAPSLYPPKISRVLASQGRVAPHRLIMRARAHLPAASRQHESRQGARRQEQARRVTWRDRCAGRQQMLTEPTSTACFRPLSTAVDRKPSYAQRLCLQVLSGRGSEAAPASHVRPDGSPSRRGKLRLPPPPGGLGLRRQRAVRRSARSTMTSSSSAMQARNLRCGPRVLVALPCENIGLIISRE